MAGSRSKTTLRAFSDDVVSLQKTPVNKYENRALQLQAPSLRTCQVVDYGMKLPGLVRSKSKRLNEELVREREGLHEKKLEVAELRANLVHEEYTRNVKEVYDFS